MKISELQLPGIALVELPIFRDDRGFFIERYNETRFRAFGLPHFCQDNHSRSVPGTLRGLHYQSEPAQGKLVGVIRGEIWDVVVDIRPTSATYGKYLTVELNDRTAHFLWIPAGFAHGFCVTGRDSADVIYKVDQPYTPSSEGGILWSDPELAIQWPVAQPLVSERDQQLPAFRRYREHPAF